MTNKFAKVLKPAPQEPVEASRSPGNRVGYGDISPVSLAGRLVAVVLMLIGIGLFATLGASVAAFLSRRIRMTVSNASKNDWPASKSC